MTTGKTNPKHFRLYVDETDLSGVAGYVRVRVTLGQEGEDPQIVFDAQVDVQGGADGTVDVRATGDLRNRDLFRPDLGDLVAEFGEFHPVIFGSFPLDYEFTAVVGEEFTLTATIEVDISNQAGGTGIGGVFGIPAESIAATINSVSGTQLGTQIQEQVDAALAVTEDVPPVAWQLLGLGQFLSGCGACGAVGFEGIAALFALAVGTLLLHRRGG